MANKERISKQELKKELENGKTFEQIAEEYDYDSESRQLRDKIRALGYRTRHKISFFEKYGSANINFSKEEMNKLLEQTGLSRDTTLYAEKTVEDGKVIVVPTTEEWEKKEDEQ